MRGDLRWCRTVITTYPAFVNEPGLTPSSLEVVEEVKEGEGGKAGRRRNKGPFQGVDGCAVIRVKLDEFLDKQ